MKTLRAVSRGLLILLTSVCLSLIIALLTLQATALNRHAVMNWFNESGFYQNVVNAVIQLQQGEGANDQQFLGEDTVRQAVNNTLDPAFLKQSSETILNSSYDWLEGKTDKIEFSIDLAAKRAELEKQLASQIKPQIETLPVCSSSFSGLGSSDVQCIPANTNPTAFAEDLAKRATNSSDFLSQPLTSKDVVQPNISKMVRTGIGNLGLVITALAAVAILSAGGYVLLCDNKLNGIQVIGRRTFFATLFIVLAGGVMWYFAKQISLSNFGDANIVSVVVDPLAHVVVSDVGKWLFIYSGIIFAIGGTLWLGAFLLLKNQQKNHHIPVAPPDNQVRNLPPANPAA